MKDEIKYGILLVCIIAIPVSIMLMINETYLYFYPKKVPHTELIEEIDGCKIYSFYDDGEKHYMTNCTQVIDTYKNCKNHVMGVSSCVQNKNKELK